MAPDLSERIRDEMDLVARFAESYRRRLFVYIDRLNHPDGSGARQRPDAATDAGLRLCVEAVDMILETQGQLAKALSQLTDRQLNH
jgi:hypothetical protein